MKTKTFNITGIFATLCVISALTVTLFSCSSDDGSDEDKLVGAWVRSYRNGKSQATEEYDFYADGTGMWENSAGTWASFTYAITAENYISMKMVYQRGSSTWREINGWHYSISGDTLRLGGNVFIKKR